MDENQALAAFAGISNQTRLRSVRFLVVAGADGRSAGAIGEALGDTSPSRLSFHLNQLQQSGLIESRREGRSIIYSTCFDRVSDLIVYLIEDCCAGEACIASNVQAAADRMLCCAPAASTDA